MNRLDMFHHALLGGSSLDFVFRSLHRQVPGPSDHLQIVAFVCLLLLQFTLIYPRWTRFFTCSVLTSSVNAHQLHCILYILYICISLYFYVTHDITFKSHLWVVTKTFCMWFIVFKLPNWNNMAKSFCMLGLKRDCFVSSIVSFVKPLFFVFSFRILLFCFVCFRSGEPWLGETTHGCRSTTLAAAHAIALAAIATAATFFGSLNSRITRNTPWKQRYI